MTKIILVGSLAGLFIGASAQAQLVPVKQLSVDMTVTLISTAARCARSDKVTIAVVDRNQVLIASFRGPLATLNTVDLARRKAASAAQFGRPTDELAAGGGRGGRGGPGGPPGGGEQPATPPSSELTAINSLRNLVSMTANGELTLGGGVPILSGDETIGAIGLSGSGATEAPCAREAIKAIQDQLK